MPAATYAHPHCTKADSAWAKLDKATQGAYAERVQVIKVCVRACATVCAHMYVCVDLLLFVRSERVATWAVVIDAGVCVWLLFQAMLTPRQHQCRLIIAQDVTAPVSGAAAATRRSKRAMSRAFSDEDEHGSAAPERRAQKQRRVSE